MNKYFIITAHGWSASNWLAYALNLHPDIVCTHSAINILPDPDYIHEKSGLKKNIRQFHHGYLNRINASVNDSYQTISSYGDAKAYGSVHLYRLRDIPSQIEKSSPLLQQYTILNMIRNPISLVSSGAGQFKQLFRFDLNELHWTLGKLLNTDKDFVFDFGERHNLYIGDHDILSFICACRILDSLKLDMDAENFILNDGLPDAVNYRGTILMENITSDRKHFSELFNLLDLNGLEVNSEYLDKVFSTGKLNQHKISQPVESTTAQHIYDGWHPWQKEVFNYFFDKYGLCNYYTTKGYDFGFLNTNTLALSSI